MRNVGVMYINGFGTPTDATSANHYFLKAAEKGNADSQYRIAKFYYHGEGIEQNYGEAFKWFEKASAQNHSNALLALGSMYLLGTGNTPQKYGKAVECFRKSVSQGFADAQFALAQCYFYGQGVDKDMEQVRYWLRVAVKQGHERAKKFAKTNNIQLNWHETYTEIDNRNTALAVSGWYAIRLLWVGSLCRYRCFRLYFLWLFQVKEGWDGIFVRCLCAIVPALY